MLIPSNVLAKPKQPTGDRINLNGGDQTFAAGEPFHIIQGWVFEPHPNRQGLFSFSLQVDGSEVDENYVDHSKDGNQNYRLWVYNFPDGMIGTHTFTGTWYAPCEVAEEDWGGGPCEKKNEPVIVRVQTITVVFE